MLLGQYFCFCQKKTKFSNSKKNIWKTLHFDKQIISNITHSCHQKEHYLDQQKNMASNFTREFVSQEIGDV